MKSGIYRIQIEENFYFGSAINLKNREWTHRGELRAGRHSNRWMQNAWNKHGIMHFEVIETCLPEELIEREQHHISHHFGSPRCMNLSPTAGSTLGVKHTEETRRNMSLAKIGKMAGFKHPLFGKARSMETKEKLRKAQLGKKFNEETAAKHKAAMNHPGVKIRMAMAHLGRKQSSEWIEKRASKMRGGDNPKSRSVELTLPCGSIKSFDCLTQAAESIEINRPTLNRWINGTKHWPGMGRRTWKSNAHLIGLTGRYL